MSRIIDQLFDLVLNIHTVPTTFGLMACDALKSENNSITGIGTINYLNLLKIRRLLAPTKQDILYDLGSGTGRLVCWFGLKRLQLVVGVELLPELCSIAQENVSRLRYRRSPLKIIQGDFNEIDLTGATILVLFNPCSESPLRLLLKKVKESVDKCPRKLAIYYHNPVQSHVFDEATWLKKTSEHKMLGDYYGIIYEHSPTEWSKQGTHRHE